MEIKKLGTTDLYISRIGFGCLSIAGFHYGRTDDEESISAIKTAIKLGINFFDTADIYGFGKSEKLLAEFVGDSKVIVATKVGVRWDEKKGKKYFDLSPEYILKAVNLSLNNLKLKKIPLYQIHYSNLKDDAKEIMFVLNSLKKAGKIGYVGCSNFTSNDLEKYQKYGRIDAIQVPYNIIDQKAEKVLSKAFLKYNMGIIVYSPLAQGFLTGKYKENNFGKNDRRGKSMYFKKNVFQKAKPLFEKMETLSKKYKKTMAQVALRWILDNPYINCVIVGAKTEKEIIEATGASGWRLLDAERSELSRLGKKVLN